VLRAITFDYWDTLYLGAALPERMSLRRAALRRMLDGFGCALPEEEFVTLYKASGDEAERWWRDEQRGYTAADRIRWLLEQLDIRRPADCEHIARAVEAVDDALLLLPAPLLPGVADGLTRLAHRYTLAVVSDTGFASGRAQDRLLEKDGIRALFAATVYSVNVGHAKPRQEPFQTALDALGMPASQVLHVGDNERTDVRGALSAGLRAIRVDSGCRAGPSAAEYVATSFEEVVAYLVESGNRKAKR
jgi:putative hydrolase of the HAD superfamily